MVPPENGQRDLEMEREFEALPDFDHATVFNVNTSIFFFTTALPRCDHRDARLVEPYGAIFFLCVTQLSMCDPVHT